MVRRLLRLVFFGWLLGEWYTRGGREFLFGESVDEPRVGLDVIRAWVTVPSPSIHHFYPASSFARMVGLSFALDGEPLGTVLEASRDEQGWARVRYEADRKKLGHPIIVAVSQAEAAVALAVGGLASRLP